MLGCPSVRCSRPHILQALIDQLKSELLSRRAKRTSKEVDFLLLELQWVSPVQKPVELFQSIEQLLYLFCTACLWCRVRRSQMSIATESRELLIELLPIGFMANATLRRRH